MACSVGKVCTNTLQMTVNSTLDHKERNTRVKRKTAQLVNAKSRLQFGAGDFQETWELVASGRHL